MSNNPIKKKKGIQIGNFLITKEQGTLSAIKITSVAGNWNIRFREDNYLFTWIKNMLNTEENKEILHLAITCWFAATSGVPDSTFLEDVLTAYTRSVDRMNENVKKLSDEADKEIIKEEKDKYSPQ